METILEIVGLVVKIDIVPTNGILTGMLVESKIEEVITEVSIAEVEKIVKSKIVVLIVEEIKIVEATTSIANDINLVAEEEGGCNLVDEVVDTSINNVLIYEGVKSDWKFNVSIVVTIKLVEAISELDVAANLTGE